MASLSALSIFFFVFTACLLFDSRADRSLGYLRLYDV